MAAVTREDRVWRLRRTARDGTCLVGANEHVMHGWAGCHPHDSQSQCNTHLHQQATDDLVCQHANRMPWLAVNAHANMHARRRRCGAARCRTPRAGGRGRRAYHERQEAQDVLRLLLLRVGGRRRDDLLAGVLADDQQHREHQVGRRVVPADRRRAIGQGEQPRRPGALRAAARSPLRAGEHEHTVHQSKACPATHGTAGASALAPAPFQSTRAAGEAHSHPHHKPWQITRCAGLHSLAAQDTTSTS